MLHICQLYTVLAKTICCCILMIFKRTVTLFDVPDRFFKVRLKLRKVEYLVLPGLLFL